MAFNPLDVFTGEPFKRSGELTRGALANFQSDVYGNLARTGLEGQTLLERGLQGALGSLSPGFERARADISGATPQALAALAGWTGLGAGALQGAQTPALTSLADAVSQARAGYAPVTGTADRYAALANSANATTADALGLNGPEGFARATAAFQKGPGYQTALEQGQEQISRAAAAAGMPASGNVLRESQQFGQGLANQEFQKWLANVSGTGQYFSPLALQGYGSAATGLANAALTGGTGVANIYTGTGNRLADLYGAAARQAPGIYQGQGTSLADLASRLGVGEAGAYGQFLPKESDLLAQLAGLRTGFTGAEIAPTTQSFQQEAAAQQAGAGSFWNLLGGLATMGAGAAGFGPWAAGARPTAAAGAPLTGTGVPYTTGSNIFGRLF